MELILKETKYQHVTSAFHLVLTQFFAVQGQTRNFGQGRYYVRQQAGERWRKKAATSGATTIIAIHKFFQTLTAKQGSAGNNVNQVMTRLSSQSQYIYYIIGQSHATFTFAQLISSLLSRSFLGIRCQLIDFIYLRMNQL